MSLPSEHATSIEMFVILTIMQNRFHFLFQIHSPSSRHLTTCVILTALNAVKLKSSHTVRFAQKKMIRERE